MVRLKHNFPKLLESVNEFRLYDAKIDNECSCIESINAENSYVWELLKLPKVFDIISVILLNIWFQLMDKCIREGNYEMAFALTNFAVIMKQSKLMQNTMVKVTVLCLVILESKTKIIKQVWFFYTFLILSPLL